MTDPIADFLTRVRNAVKANHKVVEAPASKLKLEITRVLFEQGYILAYKEDTNEQGKPVIKIALKYPRNQDQRHQGPQTCEPSGSAPLLQRRRYAARTERSGYRRGFHL